MANNGNGKSSNIKQIAAAISTIILSLGGYYGLDKMKGQEGGNLSSWINNDFTSYKEWNSDQHDKHYANNTRIDSRLDELEKWKAKVEDKIGTVHIEENNSQFRDEPHGTIIYRRNILDGNLYYDASNGRRYRVKYNQSDGYIFRYGTKPNGDKAWWKCEWDASNPMIIFNNVNNGIYDF